MRGRGFFRVRGRRKGRRRRRRERGGARLSLADLAEGESAVLASLELPDEVAQRLMELGFLPGTEIVAGKTAPGGDPRVFRVDGSEIALRRETARHLRVQPDGEGEGSR